MLGQILIALLLVYAIALLYLVCSKLDNLRALVKTHHEFNLANSPRVVNIDNSVTAADPSARSFIGSKR